MQYQQTVSNPGGGPAGWLDFISCTLENSATPLLDLQSDPSIKAGIQGLEQILISIFARGHSLLVGVPGLAKTLIISTLARCLSLSFSRIQFTPDLMPSDITGTEVIQEDKGTGERNFRFLQGPIFANVILADEINRTPPKTQAALLEAMQERQVTAGGTKHELSEPFFVFYKLNCLKKQFVNSNFLFCF